MKLLYYKNKFKYRALLKKPKQIIDSWCNAPCNFLLDYSNMGLS